MDSQNPNTRVADSVVEDIHKDFVIVGKHRVHAWYAWAIVGIVFGMALGIVYVANRSGSFSACSAAGLELHITPASKITRDGTAHIAAFGTAYDTDYPGKPFVVNRGAELIDAQGTATLTNNLNTYTNGALTYSGRYIAGIQQLPSGNQAGVYITGDAAWFSQIQNGVATIDVNQPATATRKPVILTFDNTYINSKGVVKKPTLFTASCISGFDLGYDDQGFDASHPAIPLTSQAASSRLRTTETKYGSKLATLAGMPNLCDFTITVDSPSGPKTFRDKDVLLEGQAYSGTYALNWKDVDSTTDGVNVDVKTATFTTAPNQNPVFTTTQSQNVTAGQTFSFLVSATDPDFDPVTYLAAATLPSGASLNPTTGVFAWTPAINAPSQTINLTIRALDNRGGSAQTQIAITVSANAAPPVATSTPPVTNSSTAPTVFMQTSSNTPPAQFVLPGTTGTALLRVNLVNGDVDDVRILNIQFYDKPASGTIQGLTNFTLYDAGTRVAGPVSASSTTLTTGNILLQLGNGLILPKNSSKELTLRGDAVANSGAYVFGIASNTDVSALSVANPSVGAIISGAPISGNSVTLQNSSLTISTSPTGGATTGRVRTTIDTLPNYLNFTAGTSASARLQSVELTFAGAAIASGTPPFNVKLIDADTGFDLGSATAQTCSPVSSRCTVTFTPDYTVGAGGTTRTKIRVDSSSFTNNASALDSLIVLLNTTSSVLWSDNITNNIPLPSSLVPFTAESLSYE